MKRCKNCGDEKPLAAFRKDAAHRDGHRSKCNACRREERRARYNPEQQKVINDRAAWKVRAWRYGLSEDELLTMLEQQGGCCAICQELMAKPCVDHCHETGQVRGLLCHKCNNLLGFAGDSVERLQVAQQYLLCCPVGNERNSRLTVETE